MMVFSLNSAVIQQPNEQEDSEVNQNNPRNIVKRRGASRRCPFSLFCG
jgi:hypothetical protein